MKRNNRQILVNPHSGQEKVPVGALNLGEIGVQHNNVEDAALYVETVGDSESAETVAKFITEKAIDSKIENAIDVLQMEINGLNEEIGLPHDPEAWNSGLSVWQAIEQTYEEMTAGTTAASTKLHIDPLPEGRTEKYLQLRSVTDQASSAVNYYLKTEGIDEAIESAYTIVNDKVEALSGVVESFSSNTVNEIEKINEKIEELSAATEGALDALDYTGVTQEGMPVVNVTQEDGLVNAETGRINTEFIDYNSAYTLDEVIEEIMENIQANEVASEDGTVVVDTTGENTDLSVNIDGATLVKDGDGVISSAVKLVKVVGTGTVKETYVLADKDGNALDGDEIVINKDQAFAGAQLGHSGATVDPVTGDITDGAGEDVLILEYQNQEGDYVIVEIPLGDFLRESEFKDGLQVNENHEVSVKLDSASEEVVIGSGETAQVLSVTEDGIKVDHIQDAIDYAVAELAGNIDADVTGTSQDGHVTVEVVQESTELTNVIVTTEDIASADELDTVEESVGLESDGSFTPDETTNYLSAATSVRNEIKLIDEVVKEISDKLGEVSVEEGTSFENFVSLDVTDDGNGATAITIDDTDLKQAIDLINDDIADEIVAREEADDEIRGTSASTSADTSLWGIKKLIEQLTENLNSNAVQDAEFAVLTDAERNTAHCNAGLKVEETADDGKKIQLDLTLLKVDCGEY